MKKLNLKKKVISVLTDEEKRNVQGGEGTTSYSGCTGFLCCNNDCGPIISDGPECIDAETNISPN